ncbi:MAG: ribosome recycling factor [bacterium]|nr:ribosome recycling factor [bacterium]
MDNSFSTNLKLRVDKINAQAKTEVATLRTGRITSALIEDIDVDYYGTKTPLKALASFSSPEPRQIVIQPFDKNAVEAIQKAIFASPLGFNPIAEKDVLRIVVPPLTEERKQELVKVLKKKVEEAHIHIRQARDEAMKEAGAKEKAKEISEDERFRMKNEIEKIIDEGKEKLEELSLSKEREIING